MTDFADGIPIGLSGNRPCSIVAVTDRGRIRPLNEDSYTVLEEENLVLISDGAGGHRQGNLASRIVTETVEDLYFSKNAFSLLKAEKAESPELDAGARRLITAIRLANYRLFLLNQDHDGGAGPAKNRMLATVCALALENGFVYVASVGDSRAYVFRNRRLETLTRDHVAINRVERNGQTRYQEFLTRALGLEKQVGIDLRRLRPLPDDVFLVCSDGLYKMLAEHELHGAIEARSGDLKGLADHLSSAANEKGGRDNITLALARFDGLPGDPSAEDPQMMSVPPLDAGRKWSKVLKKLYRESG